jgi:hypothetical protein
MKETPGIEPSRGVGPMAMATGEPGEKTISHDLDRLFKKPLTDPLAGVLQVV